MYHPSRGGVRGGRDQFNWDDVKIDKHRENYLGHSVRAPVGRWQRGKDLHWYTKGGGLADEEAKAEIARIQAEEDQAMREALGLAPTRENRNQGSRLDKHEVQELLKRGKTAEELSETYTAAERIQGVGFGAISANKKVQGYEMGEQLSGTFPETHPQANARSAAAPRQQTKDDVKQTKEEKREAKEKRKLEKRAAKLVRKEERKLRKERSEDPKDNIKDPKDNSRNYNNKNNNNNNRHAEDEEDDSAFRKRRRRRHDSDSE